MDNKGIYIYGIIPTYYDSDSFRKLDGIAVFNIPYKKISAIVFENTVIDYKQLGRESLAKLLIHHQKTIENVMDMGFSTIIPMRLGTFANNTTEVLEILEKGYDLIVRTIEKISNHVEIDIVATWSDFAGVLSEISVHPEVVELKEKIQKSNIDITQSDQLTIGRLVKKILDKKKEECATKMIDTLEPISANMKQHEVMNDQMVSNIAFMINKSQLSLFEKMVEQLDMEFNGKLNFKYVGPLPCYSFYTLDVQELPYMQVEMAKNELELDNSATEKEIKKAYLEKVKLLHPDTNSGIDNSESFNRISNAYKTLQDYSHAVRQSSSGDMVSFVKEKVIKNSKLIKIKE